MGNFSVSHYSRLRIDRPAASKSGTCWTWRRSPPFNCCSTGRLDESTARAELEKRAEAQAREWSRNLKLEAGGRTVPLQFERAAMVLAKGAGNMPVLRITSELRVPVAAGRVRYEDPNFPDRAGWKEIVVTGGDGAVVAEAAPKGADRSRELTAYPQDPLLAPPQDLEATFVWRTEAPAATAMTAETSLPPAHGQTAPVPAGPSRGRDGGARRLPFTLAAAGRNRMGHDAGGYGGGLRAGRGPRAFAGPREDDCGGVPGGQPRNPAARAVSGRDGDVHAYHFSVFGLGIVTWFFSHYVLPEKIFPVLGAISGISIVWIGATLFFKRLRTATGRRIIPTTIITIMRRSSDTTIMATVGCTVMSRKET